MDYTPILIEKFSWLFTSPVAHYLPWIILAWIIHWMSRIPEEIHWEHEYEVPEEFNRVRKGLFPIITIFLFAIGSIWLAWIAIPSGVEAYIQMIREGTFFKYLISSPWLIIGSSLIMVEVYLGIALWKGFHQIAQAEIPEVPKWVLDIGMVLFIIFTILVEIITLPATWPAIIIVILASLVFILFAGWALWASFPTTPMRFFFCTVLVPFHHSPFILIWRLFWGCLKWVWITAYRIYKKCYSYCKRVVLNIPKKVYRTIFVRKPVTRLVRRLVPTIPAWVPNWARKIGRYVLQYVDTLVEVVEYVIVAVVVAVIIIVTVIIFIVITVVIITIAIYLTLVCLVWGLILVLVAALILLYWWIPMWIIRLFFFN